MVRHPCGVAGRGEFLLGDPWRGRGGRGGSLYIGHRFADDRCLWSWHPQGVPRRPRQGTPVGVPPTSRTSRTFYPNTLSSDSNIGIRKDARSIDIGQGTKCRRPMYKRTYYVSTLYGSPGRGAARRPARGRGGREGVLYIGHRFADDRCLWSEHPSGASRKSLTWYTITLNLKGVNPLRYSKKVSQAPGRRHRSLGVRVASRP